MDDFINSFIDNIDDNEVDYSSIDDSKSFDFIDNSDDDNYDYDVYDYD